MVLILAHIRGRFTGISLEIELAHFQNVSNRKPTPGFWYLVTLTRKVARVFTDEGVCGRRARAVRLCWSACQLCLSRL